MNRIVIGKGKGKRERDETLMNELVKQAGRVAVLYGGTSAEREISLLSGKAVIAALRQLGVDVVAIDVGKDLVQQLLDSQPDRVFIILHGRGGEDGVVQGLLEAMGIPFTGSDVLGSALAMDKMRSKLIWKQSGISTADFVMLHENTDWEQVMEGMGKVVIKPVNEGSSIGMSLADNVAQLKQAFNKARKFDLCVMAEKYIRGNEFTVAVLAGRALPAIQLITDHDFFDYDAKYIAQDTRYICPVNLPEDQLLRLNSMSLQAFSALGCEGWGRVDVMQDQQGEFFILEVNTVPGMTSHSLVPMAASQAGLSFEQLVQEILLAKQVPGVSS